MPGRHSITTVTLLLNRPWIYTLNKPTARLFQIAYTGKIKKAEKSNVLVHLM